MSGKTTLRIKKIALRENGGIGGRNVHDRAKKLRKQYGRLNHKQKGDFLSKMHV